MAAALPTQLFLVLEPGPAAAARLEAACAAAAVPCVLILPPPGGEPAREETRRLVALAQSRGAAALLPGDAALCRALAADGVHIPAAPDALAACRAARDMLGPRAIVGAEAGTRRHDAMVLGEAGADYVGFGTAGAGHDPDAAAERLALVAWWAEIFEVPCVAFGVESAGDARELALVGAEFVAIRLRADEAPADGAGRLRLLAEAVATAAR